MKRIEIILVVLCVVGIAGKFFHLPGSGLLTVVSFNSLAIFYAVWSRSLFMGREFRKEKWQNLGKESKSASALSISSGIILFFALIALLYRFMFWPGGTSVLYLLMIPFVVLLVLNTVKYTDTKCKVYIKIVRRLAIVGGIGLLFILRPYIWYEMQYRNNPVYLNALKEWWAAPADSVELEAKADYVYDRVYRPNKIESFKKSKSYIAPIKDSTSLWERYEIAYKRYIIEDSINQSKNKQP